MIYLVLINIFRLLLLCELHEFYSFFATRDAFSFSVKILKHWSTATESREIKNQISVISIGFELESQSQSIEKIVCIIYEYHIFIFEMSIDCFTSHSQTFKKIILMSNIFTKFVCIRFLSVK